MENDMPPKVFVSLESANHRENIALLF